ncbi:rhodanese-like domain-containing protein [Rubinisphaera margarita]|uniref:rhodanese-like domain-containing protein n=1 Tax=Rubinisphaera margarita TaxID=2909586 RepID=UPI001EE8486B|nr:rhodanese-like domain-containing protein [Rubinisphaera margarita]MCG6158402.1 rhodanese [Rubinisphaera margarita]
MSELEVSCAQVKEMLDDERDFLLLDCREVEEYETVHIEGAKLMPMSEIVRKVGQIDEHREKPVIVYCHHGGRSLRVTKFLIDQGFTDVKSMAGGIDEWAEKIDPSKPRY